jgi:hypothetical protein
MKKLLLITLLTLSLTRATEGKECEVCDIDTASTNVAAGVYQIKIEGLYIQPTPGESLEELAEEIRTANFIYLEVRKEEFAKPHSFLIYSSNTVEWGPFQIPVSIEEEKILIGIEISGGSEFGKFLLNWNHRSPETRERIFLILKDKVF